jgi:molybdenum cofactor cytidylyltransferase
MFFGSVPARDAEGAILAHTIKLGPDLILTKGRVLSAADVEQCRAAGRTEIQVARIEPGDMGEDAAAVVIASAAAGAGVSVGSPVAGRCGLYSEHRGLLVIDRGDVDAMNGIDEAVTLSTAEPWATVDPGTLVATLKIIPFAVPKRLVDAAADVAHRRSPLVRVAPFKPLAAGLILAGFNDLHWTAERRVLSSQQSRLARLGGTLMAHLSCLHAIETVAEGIDALLNGGCDVLLIAGVHGTVDRRDVIPAAIERAGGTTEHLGMPVDPGHFLLLARCRGVPVIGLPGCARSLRPNGADRVLERVAAGEDISAAAIRRMGAGGLLGHARTNRAEDSDDHREAR